MRERVGARHLRETPGQVRGVPEPGLPAGDGPGPPRSPPGAARRWRLSTAHGRDLLARRGRLRQRILGRRRAGLCGDLRERWYPGRGRALTIRTGGARVVLLRGAGRRERRP